MAPVVMPACGVVALLLPVAAASGQTVESSPQLQLLGERGANSYVGLVLAPASRDGSTPALGSVCGMSMGAADVICRQLGYDFGTVSDSPCSRYGGKNACGARGSRVSMKNLWCDGRELDLSACSWEAPDSTCESHEFDSIVYCGATDYVPWTSGVTRLIAADGSPSFDGVGRLEVFHEGHWGPVCRDGFHEGEAAVACKSMGFSGARAPAATPCQQESGDNFCGSQAASLSEVRCVGSERSVADCTFIAGDAVFCAAEVSAVLPFLASSFFVAPLPLPSGECCCALRWAW